jgi:hypothetical protein
MTRWIETSEGMWAYLKYPEIALDYQGYLDHWNDPNLTPDLAWQLEFDELSTWQERLEFIVFHSTKKEIIDSIAHGDFEEDYGNEIIRLIQERTQHDTTHNQIHT